MGQTGDIGGPSAPNEKARSHSCGASPNICGSICSPSHGFGGNLSRDASNAEIFGWPEDCDPPLEKL